MRYSDRGVDDVDTGVIRMPEDRPWESPGPPPWITTARRHRRNDQRPSRLVLWIGVALLLTLAVVVAGLVVAFTDEDSGVAACRAIAEGNAADGGQTTPGAKMTEQEYQDTRKVFARSSDQDIRASGTTLVDLAWQLQQSPDSALLLASDMTRAYTGLAGACAAHGYTIPPLGAE
jgi:hypothetical protein